MHPYSLQNVPQKLKDCFKVWEVINVKMKVRNVLPFSPQNVNFPWQTLEIASDPLRQLLRSGKRALSLHRRLNFYP